MILYQYFLPKRPKNKNVCLFRYIQCQLINAACSKLSYCREWCCSTLVKHICPAISPLFSSSLSENIWQYKRERDREKYYIKQQQQQQQQEPHGTHINKSLQNLAYIVYIYILNEEESYLGYIWCCRLLMCNICFVSEWVCQQRVGSWVKFI